MRRPGGPPAACRAPPGRRHERPGRAVCAGGGSRAQEARTRGRGQAAAAACPRAAGRAGVSAPAAGRFRPGPEVTPAGMPAVAVTDRVVQIDPAAGGEVGAVFFQFGQHAHGERDGGADLLGPAFGVLPVPFRDRDQVPADDGPGPGADRQRFQVPGPAARCTRTSPPWAQRPPSGRTRAVNSAPGIPSTAVISSHSPGAAGRCPARYSTSTSPSRSASSGKPGTPGTGRPGPAGSPGTSGAGPAGPGSGLAGAVVTVMHLQGWVMGWCRARQGQPARGRRPGRSCTDADQRPTPRGTSSPPRAGPAAARPAAGHPRARHARRCAAGPGGAVRPHGRGPARPPPGAGPGRARARSGARGRTRAGGPLARVHGQWRVTART